MQTITVGEVVGVHGIKGEVKVTILTDFPEKRFAAGSKLFNDKIKRALTVESYKIHKGVLLVKFREIADRNNAEELYPSAFLIDRADLMPLPEGEFYPFQLIGLDVYEQEVLLGTITDVQITGANDVYYVKSAAEAGKEILIPALKSVVQHVDIDTGRMDVVLPAGLLDL